MMKENEAYSYTPGTCNIGKTEVNRRLRIGYIGIGLMVIFVVGIIFFHLPSVYKLGLFIPAFVCASGFVQAYSKFCFVYGWMGVASLGGRRKFKNIDDQNFVKKDRNKAISIVAIVAICSGILTVVYYFLPS